jgi:1-deoxy-D-xylulose-5-phosphate reductoisomerase
VKNLTILGSTGSIGLSTLDVLRRLGGRYHAFALAAGTNAGEMAQQILEFRPEVAVMATEASREALAEKLVVAGFPKAEWPELLYGPEALIQVATAEPVDFVMSAIVGVAGLPATYEAVRRGTPVGLANKEVLVAGGGLVMAAAKASGAEILPVDSEHNGAHQCLRSGRRAEVTRLILTASGGPFRQLPKSEFDRITPAQALNHPTWKMGQRITIDSATMMNKGFEVIEACWLFGFSPDEVQVVVHPQSTVHAMVEFNDGSVIAQASSTDMRMPIQYALTFPERAAAPAPRLDWTKARTWEFAPPDFDRFPLLRLAYEAQRAGGSATCVLNAADEVAVEAFLQQEISFPAIAEVVEETLARVPGESARRIDDILAIDVRARQEARRQVALRATVSR